MSASSRRDFLKNVGVSVPTLKALLALGPVPAMETSAEAAFDNAKFTPVELNRVLNSSSSDFGPHELARWFEKTHKELILCGYAHPAGRRRSRDRRHSCGGRRGRWQHPLDSAW